MDELIKQLDLSEHFSSLASYLAREKPIAGGIEGDIQQNMLFISEIERLNLPPLPKAQNLSSAIARIAKMGAAKIAELYDFVKIARYFESLKARNLEGKFAAWIAAIEIAPPLKAICGSFDGEGNLLSEDLARIKEAIETKKKQAKSELLRLSSHQNLAPYLVDRQAHFIGGVETLLLRGGFNHILAGRVIDRTGAGFFYVAPRSLTAINDAIEDLRNTESETIAKIERDLSEKLYNSVKFLRFLDASFDRADHLFARVEFARAKNLAIVAPKPKHAITLSEFAHPALKNPVPISIDFSKPILLVTGVNAGGKTMLLKAILSAALMAKLLVPMRLNAAKSAIGGFRQISAIIADPQNAKNDISTFAGRMAQFSKLSTAENLLLGIDEIELGTDSDEAASLFKAILERLIANKACVIATTHHKRLAALMASNPAVELSAALYDENLRMPTYSFMSGTIGKSYAFETALRYGVASAIVEEAKRVYGLDKERLNDLIERSAELERTMRSNIAALENERSEAQRRIVLLKTEREEQKAEFDERRAALEREYREAIDAAKRAAKTENSADRHRAMNEAHNLKSKIAVEPIAEEPRDFAVGESARYFGAIGTIVKIADGRALVETDGGRIYAPLSELKYAPKIPAADAKISFEKPQTASPTLDLHALRADEALELVDRFLSDALIAGFDEVLIKHGVGSGKLARVVREALAKHPRVVGFFDAPANMGGMGSTIVKL
ncbi:endonuclease MutS2 [Campylobacterota bacterium]|nr:endonuclease MutS2 [Campylobacterota bacterium]